MSRNFRILAMSETEHLNFAGAAAQRPWDARLARQLVTPLLDSWVTPNHLTTVRLIVGVAAAAVFLPGTYGWSNLAALLLILSNFLDHTDGELARISGKSSRIGHVYDIASDAVVTILLFIAIGVGVGTSANAGAGVAATAGSSAAAAFGSAPLVVPAALGALAGGAVALIFFLRMRIEEMAGKAGTQQTSLGGFETEDVLYLLPLVTLFNAVTPFLAAAAIGAPLFAIWVVIDYRKVRRDFNR